MRKAGAFFLMILLGASDAWSSNPEKAKISGICIQHLGASDKPIFPIVIAVDAESEASCRDVLGSEASSARIFKIKQGQVNAMAASIRNSRPPTPPSSYDYGTFKWTILKGQQREEIVSDRKTSVLVIDKVVKETTDPGLTDALRSIKRRLGGET
jgi:hypothetical protein